MPTSAGYRGSRHAQVPLECTMQQANVTSIRVKGLALMQVTFACCIVHCIVGIFYQKLYIWHDLHHNEMH